MRKESVLERLTEREFEVLEYLKRGLTNKEIAEILKVTHHTVKAHISSILSKFNCKNRTQVLFELSNLHLSSKQP